MQEISIKIDKDGSVRVEPSGHRGNACLQELDKLLQELERAGISTEIATQKMKREYYATNERARVTAAGR